jgi:hypothetical protein
MKTQLATIGVEVTVEVIDRPIFSPWINQLSCSGCMEGWELCLPRG